MSMTTPSPAAGFLFDQELVSKQTGLNIGGYVPPLSPPWERSMRVLFYGGWSARCILDALEWPVHYWLSGEKPRRPFCAVREPTGKLDGQLALKYPTYVGYHQLCFPDRAQGPPGRPAPLPLIVLALALYRDVEKKELLPQKWFRTLTVYYGQATIKSCEDGIVIESRDHKDQNTSPPTAMIE